MKTLLLLVCMFWAFTLKAQIVNIPDPNFKQALLNYSPTIDLNGDGEIQVSEAVTVTQLSFITIPISELTGIKSFSNLQDLSCSISQVSNVDVSNMTSLRGLYLNYNNLLTSINVSGCINLEHLNASSSTLNALTLGSITRLKRLELEFVSLPDLDLRQLDSLATLKVSGSNFGGLNISGLTQIDTIVEFSHIVNLIANGCSGLKLLKSGTATNGISGILDLSGCTALTEIFLNESSVQNIDLSSCINLRSLRIEHTSSLQYLNIKNGSWLDLLQTDPSSSSLLNICTDDFETDSIVSLYANNTVQQLPVNVSSVCSFFPGGAYNSIVGTVSLDGNGSACVSSGISMPYVAIRILDTSGISVTRYTSNFGGFTHYSYAGLFTIVPYFPYPYFNITPTTATVDFDTANSFIDSVNFCIAASGVHNDIEITVLPITPSRPGFDATYQLAYKNRGTTTQSGAMQFNYDNASLTFVSSSVSTSSQSAGQLNWNYNNLQPFERRTINVTLNLFPPPINNISDTLYYLANISPVAGDETPTDNSFVLPQLVIGSFDPNDKTCLQGAALSPADINKPLDYLIRFQNLGTDTAFNVVVLDTLSDKLDLNTLEIISTSHPCDIELKNNRLQFYFRGINLPHATINEPGSHGFVAFKIKAKPNVVIGDSLNNRASIYFDFNLPVVTNTATTVVELPSGPVPVKLGYFSLSTQQDGNHLVWQVSTEDPQTNFSLERSADGIHFISINSLSATHDRCALPFNFTDDKPLAGKNYYRLKIIDVDNRSFYSKTLVTGKSRSGVQVIAVTSDQTNTTVYMDASKAQKIQAKIIAADGRMVLSQAKILTAGPNTWTLQTAGLAKGVYSLVVYTENEVMTKRFIN